MYLTPASTPDLDPLKDSPLVKSLNALLNSLHIPIPLESPADLTPSLLIAILESLLATQIPMNFKSSGMGSSSSLNRKDIELRRKINIQSMKIFLGVLEHDVLQTDVGLSSIDPRRLAEGEWDEVIFVAELLCWVGRRTGLISSDSAKHLVDDREVLSPSGSSMTRITDQTNSNTHYLSFRTVQEESLSTVSVGERDPSVVARSSSTPSDSLSFLPRIASPFPFRPRCIHEVPSPSLLLSAELDSSVTPQRENHYWCNYEECRKQNSTGSPSRASVRYTGYIEPVDEDAELASFESSRLMNSFRSTESIQAPEGTGIHHLQFSGHSLSNEQARTLELLNERARLLEVLAELQTR